MTSKRCENCRWYEQKTSWSGRCRQRAPFMLLLVSTNPYAADESKPIWPKVESKDWCGEWAAKGEDE